MEPMEPEIALPTGEPAATQFVFSELIDGWLREGERLHELAPQSGQGVEDSEPAGTGAASPLDGWRARTAELWRTILERHRLEALVAVGLLPLMLFLVLQGRAAGHSQPAGTVRAVVTAPDLPTLRRGGGRTEKPAPPSRAR
jgi:hypothetical protein